MMWFGLASYALAAVVYGGAAAVLVAGRTSGVAAGRVRWAAGLSAVWAAAIATLVVQSGSLLAFVSLDALHTFVWTLAMLAWLPKYKSAGRRVSVRGVLLTVSAGLAVWGLVAAAFTGGSANSVAVGQGAAIYALLGMALVGVLAVEQVFRNADIERRERLRLASFAIGAIFVIDLIVYSEAALLGGLTHFSWQARGLANAALAPLVVIALRHPAEADRELALSRKVVFYTASLVGVGACLVLMALTAYFMRNIGGEWGLLLQLSFILVAVTALALIVLSPRIRAQIRVLLVKHLYKSKYDYRVEWLRLTERLGRSGELQTIARNGLEGIAGIVGSDQANLWVSTDGSRYECVASLGGTRSRPRVYFDQDPLVRFLKTTGWVIDTEEYVAEPGRYGHSFGPAADSELPQQALVVPLDSRGSLQGFVLLSKPGLVKKLNFEDHDILKTAGKQVAVALAQAVGQEQLAATRQFEAFNKLSTFLMHDLKNLIAQQDLLLGNAKKFKHRPEFIDDAMSSIESAAHRMRGILERLRNASATEHTARVDLDKLLREVCNECADRKPEPVLAVSSGRTHVEIDRERLFMAIVHAIRNAQDATAPQGQIAVSMRSTNTSVVIEVADNGAGMTEEFIRDRLFRPFDSTKGVQGMGVGAYQIRETMRAAGGSVEVDSEPGKGTTVRMIFPHTGELAPAQSVA